MQTLNSLKLTGWDFSQSDIYQALVKIVAEAPMLEELLINYHPKTKIYVDLHEGLDKNFVRILNKKSREVLFEHATTKTKQNFTAIQQW